MEKIVVTSSPRCGTSLLLHSLAEHSYGIYGGEVCNGNEHADGQDWDASANRSQFIDRHNLFKLLSIYQWHDDFRQFFGWGFRVYLYRKDRDAQLRSWMRAAESGIWSSDQAEPQEAFSVGRQFMDEQISAADEMFLRDADQVIAYEDLVDDWDRIIATLLQRAGWQQEHIEKATVKSN